MLRYELLMLAVPEITQDETKGLETLIEKTVKNAQGSLISFDRWGKYRLAFPVKRNDYGIYFLVRFEMEKAEPLLAEIASLFAISLNDLVMRHVVSRLDINKPLAYDRPPSVEDAPGDVDTFLRKNKMGGLIGGRRDVGRGETPSQSSEWEAPEEDEDEDMSYTDDQGAVS